MKPQTKVNLDLTHGSVTGKLIAFTMPILASNVRLNESGIDLTLHTNMEDVDLAGALRRFPAFKVGTLQNRKVSDTLSVITLRLRRNQEKK